MGRKKITISLSDKCLKLIGYYAETTGLESRSRVIEEAIFALSDLLKYRNNARWNLQQQKTNSTAEKTANGLVEMVDLTSKIGGTLDRFERFPYSQNITEDKVPRRVPPEECGRTSDK